MANQRVSVNSIWVSSQYIRSLNDILNESDEILLAMMTVTNPYLNQTGFYNITTKELSTLTNIPRQRVEEILIQLESLGILIYDKNLMFHKTIPASCGFPGNLKWSAAILGKERNNYKDYKDNRAFEAFLQFYEKNFEEIDGTFELNEEETRPINDLSEGHSPTVDQPLTNDYLTDNQSLVNRHTKNDHPLNEHYEPIDQRSNLNQNHTHNLSQVVVDDNLTVINNNLPIVGQEGVRGNMGDTNNPNFSEIAKFFGFDNVPKQMLTEFCRLTWQHYEQKHWQLTKGGYCAETMIERVKWLKNAWENENKRNAIAGWKFSDKAIQKLQTNGESNNGKQNTKGLTGQAAISAIEREFGESKGQ